MTSADFKRITGININIVLEAITNGWYYISKKDNQLYHTGDVYKSLRKCSAGYLLETMIAGELQFFKVKSYKTTWWLSRNKRR